jgi:hypothetical protein
MNGLLSHFLRIVGNERSLPALLSCDGGIIREVQDLVSSQKTHIQEAHDHFTALSELIGNLLRR